MYKCNTYHDGSRKLETSLIQLLLFSICAPPNQYSPFKSTPYIKQKPIDVYRTKPYVFVVHMKTIVGCRLINGSINGFMLITEFILPSCLIQKIKILSFFFFFFFFISGSIGINLCASCVFLRLTSSART